MIDFVLTAIPVFSALQFMLGFLAFYGTSFIDARATIFEAGQLAMADRENRVALGYAASCSGNSLVVGLPSQSKPLIKLHSQQPGNLLR